MYFYFSKKKPSILISAVINEGHERPSSSQDNLIAGVQLSNRLKKNQQAHGQQTNVAQDRQTLATVQVAEEASEYKSESSLVRKHNTVCTL